MVLKYFSGIRSHRLKEGVGRGDGKCFMGGVHFLCTKQEKIEEETTKEDYLSILNFSTIDKH
jgi:hypothetical protein